MKENLNRILVTGASGLIGHAVVRELTEHGYNINAVLKSENSKIDLKKIDNINFFYGDICDKEMLQEAMEGCQTVIHLAALNKLYNKDKQEFYRVNLNGTATICKMALDKNISKFIYISSCEVM